MKLGELIKDTKLKITHHEYQISNITCDSREVTVGSLFAAIDNGVTNGNIYIPQAIEKGAVAILCRAEDIPPHKDDILFLESDNPNRDFALMTANYYQKQPDNICAITGTNGKTSIADFIRQVLTMLGEKAASIGTLGLIEGNQEPIPYPNTTPGTTTLHQDLQKLQEDGYQYLVMETSSHGICQHRVSGVRFKAAGFTNLTQDHLDYHKTMENYFEAKKMLFTDILPAGATAVLNADIEVFSALKQACLETGKTVIEYGHKAKDIQLLEAIPESHGQNLGINYFGEMKEIFIPLAGEFQAMNILCALGLLHAIYGQDEQILQVISKIHGAKGRLEYIGETKSGGAIYVDYAHTPDALENVINAMRSHTSGRLHVVFGCGGDRDRTKRPIMGEIAARLADEVYVTDDNPRTENPADIRNQVMMGCPNAHNIGDRKTAIIKAIGNLQKGDVLIVAGKGHETGQYINGETFHFSDQEVCRTVAGGA